MKNGGPVTRPGALRAKLRALGPRPAAAAPALPKKKSLSSHITALRGAGAFQKARR